MRCSRLRPWSCKHGERLRPAGVQSGTRQERRRLMRTEANYWQKIRDARYSRRRILAAGGTSAAALVALSALGCGSDAKPAGTAKDTSGLLYSPTDSSAKATKGGDFHISQQADISAFNSGNGGDSANAM